MRNKSTDFQSVHILFLLKNCVCVWGGVGQMLTLGSFLLLLLSTLFCEIGHSLDLEVTDELD